MQGAATKEYWKYFEERRRSRRDGAPRAWRREGFLHELAALLLALAACERTEGFDGPPGTFRVAVSGDALGAPDAPLEFAVDPVPFTMDVEADGFAFDGSVLIEVLPSGRLFRGPVAARLENGGAEGVEIGVELAFGEVRIVATDVGYDRGDARKAACNDRRDDDGDGYVDHQGLDLDGDGFADVPGDPGCYFGDDDSEDDAGSGATGASDPLWFATPRIEDVQRSNTATQSPLEGFRPTIDRGRMIVTHRTVDGFYLTDVEGAADAAALAWRGAFAFNFSTPAVARGECIAWLAGTVQEFYGFTELSFPDWGSGGDCAGELPGPVPIDPAQPDDSAAMEPYESGLVRVEQARVAAEFRACDDSGDGEIDFDIEAEAACSDDCGNDPDCAVLETLIGEKQWTARLGKGTGAEVGVQSNDADPSWDPLDHAGETIPAITGVLRHLSFGRPAWILIPRDADDFPVKESE